MTPNSSMPSVRRPSSMPLDDIAPLVRSAHLQAAAIAAVKLDEVVGLQHHVVELDEAQGLLALEPELDRVVGQHAVDAEMPAVVAQEIDVVQRVEPIGVVDHHRAARAVAEAQELGEHALDAGDVRGDLGVAQQLARLVLAGGVADLGGAAADQDDRAMAGLLQLAQHHDADEIADMQRRRRAVEADIAGEPLAPREPVQSRLVRRLMDVAAGLKLVQEVRFRGAHRLGRLSPSPKQRTLCASCPCRGACRDRHRPPPSARPCGPRRSGWRRARSDGR